MSLWTILGYLLIIFWVGFWVYSTIDEIVLNAQWDAIKKKKKLDEYEKKKAYEKKEQQRKEIRNHGVKWKKIDDLNYKYVPQFKYIYENLYFVTKTKGFKCEMTEEEIKQALLQKIRENIGYFGSIIHTADENARLYEQYKEEAHRILASDNTTFSPEMATLEMEMCQAELVVPVCSFTVDNFDFKTVKLLLQEAIETKEKEQVNCIPQRHYRESIKPKLRYEILKRDHFRCTLCGASANDGVKLHVDHIFPVSRGGSTTRANLRTLCAQCNLGKGAAYDPSGNN